MLDTSKPITLNKAYVNPAIGEEPVGYSSTDGDLIYKDELIDFMHSGGIVNNAEIFVRKNPIGPNRVVIVAKKGGQSFNSKEFKENIIKLQRQTEKNQIDLNNQVQLKFTICL